jgi:hypothetical protein
MEVRMKIKRISSKIFIILIVCFLLIGVSFTGCKAYEEAMGGAEEPGYDYDVEEMEEAPAEMEVSRDYSEETLSIEEEKAASDAGIQYSDTTLPGDRMVIKTAYIDLEVEKGEFEDVLFAISNLAEQNGGFVSNTYSNSDSEGNLTSGGITIRIPHNKYSSAIEKVKDMGVVKSISVSGQDVTQEYVDLESRLKNYEAQQDVLLDLMEQSKKVSDSLEVQSELSNVQEQIEIIKGRMNYLDDLVAFSTIEVYLYEPEPIKTTSDWGFVEALKRGFRGAVTVFNYIIMVLIVTAPVWILAGIIVIIVWQAIRARNRRRAKKEKK